jgi:multidrug efflux pump
VIGGMLSATLLGVLFVPIFFVFVLSLRRKRPQCRRKNTDSEGEPA